VKRVAAILLALIMFAPTIVPSVAAQAPGPDDPAPDQPDPDQPDPDQPEPDQPDPEDPPEEPDPENPPEPEQPTPDGASTPSAENPTRATYFEENFTSLDSFVPTRLEGNQPQESLWHIEPIGDDGSKAAVLSSSNGLPRGLHQGLVSDPIDLEPVPSRTQNALAQGLAESSVDRAGNTGQEAVRTGAGSEGATSELGSNPTVTLGPISIPDGPATLSMVHRYLFDDTANAQGQAVSGFTVEARGSGGEWVPVEGLMAARPLHDAGAPGPNEQIDPTFQNVEDVADTDLCAQYILINDLADSLLDQTGGFDESSLPGNEQIEEACKQGSGVPTPSRNVNDALFRVGDQTLEASSSNGPNQTVLANAFIQPLDERGFTGVSDTDGDGETETVGHQFDLTPWAGEEVELRLRAGTTDLTEVPEGFWAIDHLAVKAASKTNDLRLNLTAPSGDHEAPANKPFPLKAEIQNVGFVEQEGPFHVEFTYTNTETGATTTEIVPAPAQSLEFLETTTAQLPVEPLDTEAYSIQAKLVETAGSQSQAADQQSGDYVDEDPDNDVDADRLPVRTVRDVDISVRPGASVFDADSLVNATVVVESESNVVIREDLNLTAFPYDAATQLPVGGESQQSLGSQPIVLPPSADKHPLGFEDATASPPPFKGKLSEGAYFLVAELGDQTARAPVGVGTPPPPVLSEDFSGVDPGPSTYEFEASSGRWTVQANSDVGIVPNVLDPGSLDDESAWIPMAHESSVIRAEDDQHLVNGSLDTGQGQTKGITCSPNPDPQGCDAAEPTRLASPIVLDSPRGTQRVHAMAHEVALHDVSRAELSFSSALVPPADGSGQTQAQVYVSTSTDINELLDQLTDPENCPDLPEQDPDVPNDDPCQVVNDLASGVGSFASGRAQAVYNIEQGVRCGIVQSTEQYGSVRQSNLTCPGSSGDREGPAQACQEGNQLPKDSVCYSQEPAGAAALAPMLSGTLVKTDETPHAWQGESIDLSAWAGQNVTVGIVFVSESQTTSQSYDAYPTQATVSGFENLARLLPLSGTIETAPPERPRGAYLVSDVRVLTDEGARLEASDVGRSATQPQNVVQNNRPDQARGGWDLVGYRHVEDIGNENRLLKTSAQLLAGDADPVATGADPSEGLNLGTKVGDQTGVRILPGEIGTVGGSTDQSQPTAPGDRADPAQDPAVTVVSSPVVDLTGTDDPVVRFQQQFDLGSRWGDGHQFLAGWYSRLPDGDRTDDHDDASDAANVTQRALQVDDSVVYDRCQWGDALNLYNGTEKANGVQIPIEDLRCVLEAKQEESPEYNVQNKVLDPRVSEPPVSSGLFIRAEVLTGPDAGQTQLVEPVNGYRYPIGDAGAFEPTLRYQVESPDTFPGMAADTSQGELYYQGGYVESRESRFNQTPVFAGSSDVDGDGEADWVPTALDLSEFAGEKVKLEFVLTARHLLEETTTGDEPDTQLLSEQPYSIDGLEVVESGVEGEVALESLDWPRGKAAPGEDLPVRLTVTSPTGLDAPINAKAVLVDSQGCKQAEVSTTARYENAAGRSIPMPEGASFELPSVVFDGSDVDGAPPYTVKAAVDVGATPSLSAPSSVESTVTDGSVVRNDLSGAIASETNATGAPQNATLGFDVQDADECDPDPSLLAVGTSGNAPADLERYDFDGEQVPLQFRGHNLTVFLEETNLDLRSFEDAGPKLVAVTQGSDGTAGGETVLFHEDTVSSTISVEAPNDRVPVGAPAQLEVEPLRDADDAYLFAMDPSQEDPDPERLWTGSLEANEETRVPFSLSSSGPRLLVLTAEAETSGTDTENTDMLGGAFVVATEAESSGDPTRVDNVARIGLDAAEIERLAITDLEADPLVDLSTTPRTITATVQNAGTTPIENVRVEFRANGEFVAEQTRDTMLPGATETFTLPEYRTGDSPSTVLRAIATADNDLETTDTIPLRSLVKLRSLSPQLSPDSDGWSKRGSNAIFQTPDTGEAPQDVTGSINLTGARMAGLAGVAVQLDHDLDMEDRFDGGQVLLENRTDDRVLSAGPATKQMGPFSPVGGQALTGERNSTSDPVQLNSSGTEQTLVDDGATDLLGEQLLGDNEIENNASCLGQTFTDSSVGAPDTDGGYCEWSNPLVPTPESAMSKGVWHFQPESYLSPEEGWNVTIENENLEVQVREVDHRVYLEAGESLVEAAKQTGKLNVEFEEARRLIPEVREQRTQQLTVQVCAHFFDSGKKDTGPGYSLDKHREVCSSLQHDSEQDKTRDWSTTPLSINLPGTLANGPQNMVRLELSMRQDREKPRTTSNDTGLMNEGNFNSGLTKYSMRDPVKGWFVGPVTASAGGEDKTWEPDAQALDRTDPRTGAKLSPPDQTPAEDNLENWISGNDATIARVDDVVDQFGLFAVNEAEIVGSNGASIETSTKTPSLNNPIKMTPCPWHATDGCGAWKITNLYSDKNSGLYAVDDSRREALLTAPQAMGLACSTPNRINDRSIDDPEEGTDGSGNAVEGCGVSGPEPGFGPQVLSNQHLDKQSEDACVEEDGVGSPVLWRTRCLFVDRVNDAPSATEEGSNLRFATTDLNGQDEEVPNEVFRNRGHSVTFRTVVPADLRYAAANAEAWANPVFESPGDDSRNQDLYVDLRAQARVKGTQTWQPVPVCSEKEVTDQCETTFQTIDSFQQWLHLSEFVGQEAEIAIEYRIPHPTLLNDPSDDPSVLFDDLRLDAGYLKLVDEQMRLRSWTDPSIQGDGWNVRGVELFGIPIEENLGLADLDSKMIRGEATSVPRMHVHVSQEADRDVFMTAPFNVTLYNQGSESRSVPLDAALEGYDGNEWAWSDAKQQWTNNFGSEPHDVCNVELQSTDPDVDVDGVELAPGTSKRVETRVLFVPANESGRLDPKDEGLTQNSLEDCFPGQFDGDESVSQAGYDFQLHLNVSDSALRDEDYIDSDNVIDFSNDDNRDGIPLRPNPFRRGASAVHEFELNVSDLTVSPTRPAEGQLLRVNANVSLVDLGTRGANVDLRFVDLATGNVTLDLEGTDADRPTNTFSPYETTELQWTIPDPPEGTQLVELKTQIERNDQPKNDTDRGWMAKGSVASTVEHYTPGNAFTGDFEAEGDFEQQGTEDGSSERYYVSERNPGDASDSSDGCVNPGRLAGINDPRDDGSIVEIGQDGFVNTGQCTNPNQLLRTAANVCPSPDQSTARVSDPCATIDPGSQEDTGQGYRAILATESRSFENSPPPLAAITARWQFPSDDVDPSTEGRQVADGWAVQVCQENEPGGCGISTQREGGQWSTVELVQTPADTGSTMADLGNYGIPSECTQSLPLASGDTRDNCGSATGAWAHMQSGQDVVAGTSPGFALDRSKGGAFRTVLADLTSCPGAENACPDWGSSSDRSNNLLVRVIAFGSNNYTDAKVTVEEVSIAPVAFGAEPRQSDTGGFPIPEEAPKAVPFEAENLGEIGTQVDPTVEEPEGWDVGIEGLSRTGAIERSTTPRLLVTAPVSPSGVSQSATLLPSFDVPVDDVRSVSSLVPIGVRAGQHPDLQVESVQLSDDPLKKSDSLVQVRIKNAGFDSSEETEVTGVARYSDGKVDLLEPPKDQDSVTIPGLPPGVETTVVLKWTPSQSGNATLRLATDLAQPEPLAGPVVDSWDGGDVRELKECSDLGCNNVGTRTVNVEPPREADTRVDVDVLADTPLIVGEPVDVRVTVSNGGPATVPAFEVKLLAGVISLLEEDPLRVTEPLAPGESWSRTVQLIPGFGGDLNVQAKATADESIVRELRGLKSGGGTFDADNVETLEVPVVSRGLSIDPVQNVVSGESITSDGEVRVPVELQNLGTDPLDVSAAAKTTDGIGTLVGDDGEPVGSITLAPGETVNATLLVLYDQLPPSGRQPVTIDTVSEAGAKRQQVQVEVPREISMKINPVVGEATAGKTPLPVTVSSTGNADIQAQLTVSAPGVSRTSETVDLGAKQTATQNVTSWLKSFDGKTVEGEVTARAGGETFKAPLRVTPDGDVIPTLRGVKPVGGAQPHTWVNVANLGSVDSRFDLTLVQDNETLAETSVRVGGGANESVTLDAIPEPGQATVLLEDRLTNKTMDWQLDAPDLRADLRVISVRPNPASASEGEQVNVQAKIANNGGSPVTIQPGLFVDGVLHTVSSTERTVEPGGVVDVILPWTAKEGDHTLTLDADPQDRIEDGSPGDDAMAREIRVGGDAPGSALRGVPGLTAAWAVALISLAALTGSRRDST